MRPNWHWRFALALAFSFFICVSGNTKGPPGSGERTGPTPGYYGDFDEELEDSDWYGEYDGEYDDPGWNTDFDENIEEDAGSDGGDTSERVLYTTYVVVVVIISVVGVSILFMLFKICSKKSNRVQTEVGTVDTDISLPSAAGTVEDVPSAILPSAPEPPQSAIPITAFSNQNRWAQSHRAQAPAPDVSPPPPPPHPGLPQPELPDVPATHVYPSPNPLVPPPPPYPPSAELESIDSLPDSFQTIPAALPTAQVDPPAVGQLVG